MEIFKNLVYSPKKKEIGYKFTLFLSPHQILVIKKERQSWWLGDKESDSINADTLRIWKRGIRWIPVRGSVCSFPIAGDLEHTLDSLKQHSFIPSQFWRPEVWHQYHWTEANVSAGPRSLWKSKRRICSSCLALVATGIPWLLTSLLNVCS